MKRLISVSLTIAAFVGIASCKKQFLETSDTIISKEQYINSLSSSNEFLNGLYIALSTVNYDGLITIYPELMADNIKTLPGASLLFIHYNWNQLATNEENMDQNMNFLWLNSYKLIRDCNYLIENIDRFSAENPVKAQNIKGQALAIRALVYHHLVCIFAQPYQFTGDASHAGIPYFTTSDNRLSASRETVGQVYSKIISDLSKSIELISSTVNSKVLINQNAAKALLARIYLFKGDYLNAKNIAKEVSTAVPILNTSNYPSKLFTPGDSEALFRIPPSTTGYTTWFQAGYLSSDFYLQFLATSDIVNLLSERPNDLRNKWVKLVSGSWEIKKFPKSAISGISYPDIAYYHTVIRSSEMYLTAAESYAKIGKEDSARFYLDEIRQRADITATASMATGTALIDSIYKERRKELCFESMRMFDLLRWGKAVNRNDVTGPATSTLPYPSNKAVAPIPLIDVKQYPLAQNPDY